MDAEELLRAIWRNWHAIADATDREWDRLCDEQSDLMRKAGEYFAAKRNADTTAAVPCDCERYRTTGRLCETCASSEATRRPDQTGAGHAD